MESPKEKGRLRGWRRLPATSGLTTGGLTEEQASGLPPSPEEIFGYVYAVLHAATYREKYAGFLRLNFPHIPFTVDRKLFEALAAPGGRLVALHLLKSPEIDPPAARFEGVGKCLVARSPGQSFRLRSRRSAGLNSYLLCINV
jgi:hypothetical protein